MPTPRPYGTGAYGVGYYSRYRGNIYEVGGGTLTLVFSAKAHAQRVQAIGARTGIAFNLHALGLERSLYAAGAASISWHAVARGVTQIIKPQAISSIVFDVWSEHLSDSWMLPPPCEAGAWQDAEACLAGAWASPGVVPVRGSWSGTDAEQGAWDAPADCSDGVWAPRRLT